jgi:hypothetical protein
MVKWSQKMETVYGSRVWLNSCRIARIIREYHLQALFRNTETENKSNIYKYSVKSRSSPYELSLKDNKFSLHDYLK